MSTASSWRRCPPCLQPPNAQGLAAKQPGSRPRQRETASAVGCMVKARATSQDAPSNFRGRWCCRPLLCDIRIPDPKPSLSQPFLGNCPRFAKVVEHVDPMRNAAFRRTTSTTVLGRPADCHPSDHPVMHRITSRKKQNVTCGTINSELPPASEAKPPAQQNCGTLSSAASLTALCLRHLRDSPLLTWSGVSFKRCMRYSCQSCGRRRSFSSVRLSTPGLSRGSLPDAAPPRGSSDRSVANSAPTLGASRSGVVAHELAETNATRSCVRRRHRCRGVPPDWLWRSVERAKGTDDAVCFLHDSAVFQRANPEESVKGMYPAPHIHEHLRYINGYGKLRTSLRTT